MGAKTNYFRLGLFVVAAISAAVASIVILLGPSLGKPYAEMETYFQFSISGLEVGAPVKFRGIQVGQVQRFSSPPKLIRLPPKKFFPRQKRLPL